MSSTRDRLAIIWATQQQQQAAQEAEAQRQAQLDAISRQEAEATAAAAAQLAAANEAQDRAYRASLIAGDTEDARAAAERQQKKKQAARGFMSTLLSGSGSGELGAAPVAAKTLLGA